MNRKILNATLACLFFLLYGFLARPADTSGKPYAGKKILFINSYHRGYYWSDGEQKGFEQALAGTGVEFSVVYLDAKNNPSESFKRDAAFKVKQYIEQFKPDVVVAADDDAFKYVIVPYYRDSGLPVVFCGINWDISLYGAPFANTTGMIEVGLIESLFRHLKKYSSGSRVGLLGFDSWSERKNAEYSARSIPGGFVAEEYVGDFESWKEKFLELQEKVDILLITSWAGISGWDTRQAAEFIVRNARVPVGTDASVELMPLALIGLVKIPEEQGIYAARCALRILEGVKPSQIPVTSNKRGDLFINLALAEKLDVIFTPAMLRNAKVIIDKEWYQ